ncbi:MAG: large repetitive protein, partial [Acidobacteriota bacterium]|nr:large repetitive protein [Acidobacteriota bacterium]
MPAAIRSKCAVVRLLLLTLLTSALPLLAQSSTYTQLWGPKTFTRVNGQQVAQTETITGLTPGSAYELRITNHTVSSAIVKLNGVELFGTSAFNQQTHNLVKAITLAASNVLTVEVRGKPAEAMTVSVWGNNGGDPDHPPLPVDTVPPTIVVTAAPLANANGWRPAPVRVSFRCSDDQAVAACTPDVIVTTDGANQVFTGQAQDAAGHVATASITINIDSAPPTLAITAPSAGATVMTAGLGVSGSVSDALSGLAGVTCNGAPGVVSGSTFNCAMSFEDGPRSVTVVATDKAGNSTTRQISFGVLTTPRVTLVEPVNLSFVNISPITVRGTVSDPTATVKINGIAATQSGGSFSVTVPLVEGNNTLSAVAHAASGKIGTGNVQVTLDTTPPRLAVTSPANGFETVESTIAVAGTVNDIVVGTVNDQQAQVTVNGVNATVSNRTFIVPAVALAAGENTIQVVARDRVGNSFTSRITVTRNT